MKRRGLIILSVAIVLGAAGLVASANMGDANRRRLYIFLHDKTQALGLGTNRRDREHMQRMSGLADVSNVSCHHCHGITLDQMPWNKPRPRHPTPEGMAISRDGRILYVALADLDQVIQIDTERRVVTRRASVSGKPIGLSLDPTGRRLYLACRDSDTVTALDTATLSVTGTANVGIAPVAVVFCGIPGGGRLVVANSGSDDVSILDAASMEEVSRLRTGREPYGLTSEPGGHRVFVASRLAEMPRPDEAPSSELTVIDAARTRVVQRFALESAHLSESVAVVTNRGWVIAPVVRVRNLVPITQVARGWVMSGGLAVTGMGDEAAIQIPLDEANAYYADPAGVAVHPNGTRAYVASGGGDVVTVIDLDRLAQWLAGTDATQRRRAIQNLELSSEYVVTRVHTGRNPSQLVLSPDGDMLYVGERLQDSILIVDTRENKPLGRIELGDGGNDDPIRRGERMFTTAAKTFQGEFSCRSCHPGGHVDGLTYDFDGDGIGDNMLDNRSLQGLAGTWPFKWNGKNPSLKVQCGPRFARVLMRTDPFSDDELRDLVAFLESMPPARTRSAHQLELTPSEQRGREIFFATRTPEGKAIPVDRQCQHCHAPPLYTSRMKTNVGTQSATDATGDFDTPHLLGIGASAPYLHDGRAKTLEELWTVYQTNDLHGVSSYMNKHQLNDLIEFLKIL